MGEGSESGQERTNDQQPTERQAPSGRGAKLAQATDALRDELSNRGRYPVGQSIGLTRADIAAWLTIRLATNVSPSTAQKAVNALVDEGLLTSAGKGLPPIVVDPDAPPGEEVKVLRTAADVKAAVEAAIAGMEPDDEVSTGALAAELGVSRHRVFGAVSDLANEGKLTPPGQGVPARIPGGPDIGAAVNHAIANGKPGDAIDVDDLATRLNVSAHRVRVVVAEAIEDGRLDPFGPGGAPARIPGGPDIGAAVDDAIANGGPGDEIDVDDLATRLGVSPHRVRVVVADRIEDGKLEPFGPGGGPARIPGIPLTAPFLAEEWIRAWIREHPDAEVLPAPGEIADALGAHSTTVREALDHLVEDGIVERPSVYVSTIVQPGQAPSRIEEPEEPSQPGEAGGEGPATDPDPDDSPAEEPGNDAGERGSPSGQSPQDPGDDDGPDGDGNGGGATRPVEPTPSPPPADGGADAAPGDDAEVAQSAVEPDPPSAAAEPAQAVDPARAATQPDPGPAPHGETERPGDPEPGDGQPGSAGLVLVLVDEHKDEAEDEGLPGPGDGDGDGDEPGDDAVAAPEQQPRVPDAPSGVPELAEL
jgi:DNA-binding GntR family transcriptional regulator